MEKHYLKDLENKLIKILDIESKRFEEYILDNINNIDFDDLEYSLQQLVIEYKKERKHDNDGELIAVILLLKLAVGNKLYKELKDAVPDIPDKFLDNILYGNIEGYNDDLKSLLSVYENIPERFMSTFIDYYDTIENEEEYINNIYTKLQNYNRFHAVNSLGSIAADIENYYHRKLDLPPFEWMTQDDDIVRPTHAARFHKLFNEDGSMYDNSSTPDGKDIVPGEEEYCRCYRRYNKDLIQKWWNIKKKEVENIEI